MMNTIALVVAWIFIAVFAVTLILALLDLAGIRPILDPVRRKWLFGTLIVSVVSPVLTFGTKVFDGLSANTTITTSATPSDRASPPAVPTVAATGKPTETEAPVARPSAEPAVPGVIAEWVSSNMPTRPKVSVEFETQYPPCAANLRSNANSGAIAADAAQCRSDLEGHKLKFVSGYFNVKSAYDAAIKAKQIELSRRGLTPDETAIYNFLQAENEDLNYREGQSWKAIVAAETRINNDIEFSALSSSIH